MSKERVIRISQIVDATKLVQMAMQVDGDVTLTRGKYSVDGKSIMGIFALDLSGGVTISYPEDATAFDEFIASFEV